MNPSKSMTTPIDISEEAGVRYLHFGSEWVQGAMRIRAPYKLELAYTREMMAGLLMYPEPWPRKVLIIGLGAASLVKFFHRNYPETEIRVVEIEPQVVAAAAYFFKLPEEDERLSIILGDGADFIEDTDECFDYVFVDGFDQHADTGRLAGADFYKCLRDKLSDQAVVAANMFNESGDYLNNLERLMWAFDERVLAFPSADEGNAIAFAAIGEPVAMSLTEMRKRADTLKQRNGLNLLPTISRLEQAGHVPGGMLRL